MSLRARRERRAPLHGQRLAGLWLAPIGENPHLQSQNASRFCARLIERKSDMAKRDCRGDGHKQLRKCVL